MSLLEVFEVMSASVIGTDHRAVGRNNQDAVCCLRHGDAIVIVLCDGCSGEPYSEVGASLGSKIIAETLLDCATRPPESFAQRLLHYFNGRCFFNNLLDGVQEKALKNIQEIAAAMGGDIRETIRKYFLFTTIGILVTPSWSMVFALGDGMFSINDEVVRIGPFSENKPPYLAYAGLLETEFCDNANLLRLHACHVIPTNDVFSLCVGTDGAWDLMQASEQTIPRTGEPVGGISQFWQRDIYFKNPAAGTNRLALINRETLHPNWDDRMMVRKGGLLPDDTTIAVVRRKRREG